jgi:hypothetical protein
MIKLRSLPPRITLSASLYITLCIFASALLFPALAQGQAAAPAVRIVNRIDESQLVTLKGNTPPFANAKHDMGKVADSLPMTDLILVLSRDQAQQAAFDAYVSSEYDQNSPNFHQWLTPDQVGEQFGPSQTDILTITNWLTGHGFTVSQVTKDRMSIRFGGNAGQVQSAFHTEIHNLTVKGQAHIGNMSDPQIPASLATVVVGIKSLHNFFPKPLHHLGKTAQLSQQTHQWMRQEPTGTQTASASARSLLTEPQFSGRPAPSAKASTSLANPLFGIQGSSGGYPYLVEDIGPWDFATIYNVAPLWNGSTSAGVIDGTGQTIAIAGTSAICLGQATPACETTSTSGVYNDDVTTFRTFFDLPTNNSANTPMMINGSPNQEQPLTVCTDTTGALPCGIDDLIENSLDVEWSGSVAKNAQIVLVATYPNSATDDNLYDSESYIVDHLTARIMNVSYGECELGEGASGNVEYYNLWQTAAAEGIAVFVATGDSGSPSCDDGLDATYGTPYPAEFGLSVSGLASTPFNTAVGGTDFNWCPLLTAADATSTSNECQPGTYWNSSNSTVNQSSAKGYVPEVPWNNTCTSPLALPFMESYLNNTTYFGPYYGSGNQTYTVTDAETACNSIVYWDSDYFYYTGQGLPTAIEDLVDTVGGSGGASSCIDSGTINDLGTTTYSMGTPASCTGSTVSTSSGTVNLVNDGWPKPSWQVSAESLGVPSDSVRDIPDVSFFASDGALSSSAYLVCVSAAASFYGNDLPCSYSTNVEPVAQEVGGTSVATPAMAGVMALINQKSGAAQGFANPGLYALAAKQNYSNCSAETVGTSSSCYFNDIDTGTNAMACDYDAYTTTPSPNCTPAHAGDYIGILPGYSAKAGYDQATGLGSLNVANVVNGWTATAGLAIPTVTVTPQSYAINSAISLTVTVSVTGSAGTPTGTIKLSGPGYAQVAETIGTSPCTSNTSCVFTIPANTFSAGTVTLTAAYGGDASYAAGSGISAQVTVTQSTLPMPTVTVTPQSSTLNSNASLSVTVSVTGSGVTPTGTITLSGGGYSSASETIGISPCTSNTACVFTIPANTLIAGPDTLTATYSGDSNYAAATGTGSVTVTESSFTLTAGTATPSSVTPGSSGTEIITVTAKDGYTGTVTLSCAQTSTNATNSDGTTCAGSGSSTQVTLTSTTTTGQITFTIGTIAPTTAALARPKLPGGGNKGWLGAGSGAVLALLVFFGIPARRRGWRNMLSILVALVALGALSSCGGGSSSSGGGGGQSDPGTTAGTYTYTVTATPKPSVTPTVPPTTFTVTVN